MTEINRENLVVARKPGTRLLLAGGPRMDTSFEGPSERTLFFARDTAEEELRRLRVPLDRVEFRPASLRMQIQ